MSGATDRRGNGDRAAAAPPTISSAAVLVESEAVPEGTPICRGFDFNEVLAWDRAEKGRKHNSQEESTREDPGGPHRLLLDRLMESYMTTGFQATSIAMAIERIREMRAWRLSNRPICPERAAYEKGHDIVDMNVRRKLRARIFLAHTSNQVSSGQREVIRFLVQHRMVDVIVTTAGAVEEDIIKCTTPTYMGDFALKGRDLRKRGVNRIGNLLVPNQNYCEFEDWLMPILHKMHDEQDEAWRNADAEDGARFVWTPSSIIHRLGKEVNHPDSVLYWASKNEIPIFCPAITDGSLGDMLYFHSYKRPGLIVDLVQDIRRINDLAVQSFATGMIILGGGLVKHHTCNANLMRNGADYAIYINTAHDFDGSDAGASPDEAISWGKIRMTADPVKVTADATIVFPLIVSQTFAKDVDEWKEATKDCACWWEEENEEGADK